MRNGTQAQLSDLRRHTVAVFATLAIVPTLYRLFGGSPGWISVLCLSLLSIAAWILDPLILAVSVGAVGLAGLALFSRLPVNTAWMPQPLAVWLTIALVHLLRMEVKVREDLRLRDAELRSERNNQLEWRSFLDNSPAAILTADGNGRIILANAAARKLLGCEDRPIEGLGIGQSIAALGAALRIDRNKTLFHTLTGCTGWRPNGEMFVADAWFSICETPSGTRLGAVVVDASERLQERARGGLRSSMATSEIAMGAVLHEIRNLSAAAALMYTNLAHAEMAHLAGLQKHDDFDALGSLIKALASLASTELRPGEISHSSVNLIDVLAQLRIIIGPWFLESEITINWAIASDLPEVWGEEAGLLQLFLNLAQNSNKAMLASQERQLTIEACVAGDWVVVRFIDTGPGIQNPEQLFEPFCRSAGIKGLGLFVSRAIAHSFHGELKYTAVESGACFTVELLPLREWQKVTGAYGGANVKS